ncbi:MAG TPA: ABC transporter permease [Puia sp.]|nr:ABC transporter permease [Puia sp.]
MLKSYFRIAWRNIIRNKTYAFINILGLTLGICACLVVFPIIHYELSFDNFHPDGKHIYRMVSNLRSKDLNFTAAVVPPPLARAARKETSGWEEIAPVYTLSDSIIFTESSYFNIFTYDWLAGNPAAALGHPFSVVLSEASARRHFGNIPPGQVVGKEMVYKDSLRVTVTGIVKDWQGNTDFPYTDFISLNTIPVSFMKDQAGLDQWGNDNISEGSRAFIKLKKDVPPARIESQLTSLAKGQVRLPPDKTISFALQPVSDVHFNSKYSDPVPKASMNMQYILAGIALFILLLAVINFINLSTALSIRRAKEVGIRKVLGSSRKALTIQFLAETGILTLFSLVLAALLVNPVLHLFHTMVPARWHFNPFSPGMLAFLTGIAVVTTLLSGLYPARIISSWLPVLCLKGNGAPTGSEKWWLRKGLIVFQFAISLIFIISTMIISRQIDYMSSEDLGFSTDAILNIDTQRGDTTRRAEVLAEKLTRLSGISEVTRQSFSPISGFITFLPLQYKGAQMNKGAQPINISAALQAADRHFIPLYNIKLLAGMNIRPTDRFKEVVINESMVREMGLKDPQAAVGRQLLLGESELSIIGVVADFHEHSYRMPITPLVMADLPPAENNIAVKLATNGKNISHLKATLTAMERQWKAIYPGVPFSYTFLDEDIQRIYEKEKETAFLLSAAMVVTIFISCMGLFGLSMFTARQRTKEVGIRKVLGASAAGITILLSRNVIALVVLANIIASPIAWYGTQIWLRDFAYRAHISPWIFVIAGAAALGIALITISWQTIKTALINPAKVLRTE